MTVSPDSYQRRGLNLFVRRDERQVVCQGRGGDDTVRQVGDDGSRDLFDRLGNLQVNGEEFDRVSGVGLRGQQGVVSARRQFVFLDQVQDFDKGYSRQENPFPGLGRAGK